MARIITRVTGTTRRESSRLPALSVELLGIAWTARSAKEGQLDSRA
jgi:hypothetical protein